MDDKKVVLDGVERLNRLVASFILPDLAAAFEQLQTKVLCLVFIIVQSLIIGKNMSGPSSAFSSFRLRRETLEYEDVKNYSAKKFRYGIGCTLYIRNLHRTSWIFLQCFSLLNRWKSQSCCQTSAALRSGS